MVRVRPPTATDLFHLQRCHEQDEWHRDDATFEQWITAPGGITTFYDDAGPIFHMAFFLEGKTLRLHAQFDSHGGKFRTARTIIVALDRIERLARENGTQRLAIWTKSPGLEKFMTGLGFVRENEDLILELKGK